MMDGEKRALTHTRNTYLDTSPCVTISGALLKFARRGSLTPRRAASTLSSSTARLRIGDDGSAAEEDNHDDLTGRARAPSNKARVVKVLCASIRFISWLSPLEEARNEIMTRK